MNAAQFKPGPWYWLEYLDYLGVAHFFVCRQNFRKHDYLLTPAGNRRHFRSEIAADIAVAKANKDAT